VIEVPLSIGGVALTLVDTAGLRETNEEIERIGIGLAERRSSVPTCCYGLARATTCRRIPALCWWQAKLTFIRPRPAIASRSSTERASHALKRWITEQAVNLIPSTEQPGLNQREADLLAESRDALVRAASLIDPVLIAEELRLARTALDRISGLSGVEGLPRRPVLALLLGKIVFHVEHAAF
jgi:tRNA modification GTPase